MLKIENRNSQMIDPLTKKFVIDNTVWDTNKIIASYKEDPNISIYPSELDIQDIPDVKVTYYPKSMILISIEYN